MKRFFVSHASRDAALAAAIVCEIETQGASCWMAPRDIPLGASYAAAIVKAIREADAVIALLTEAGARSKQVLRELERASSYERPISAVLVGDYQLPADIEYFIASFQHERLEHSAERDAIVKLVHALIGTATPIDEQALTDPTEGLLGGDEPPAVGRFIGREAILNRLGTVRSGLVLITGIAGIGKTQVAGQLYRRTHSVGIPAYWRRVTAVDGPETLTDDLLAFLRALPGHGRVNSQGPVAARRELLSALRHTEVLIVFDELESARDQQLDELWRAMLDVELRATVVLTARVTPAWMSERDAVAGRVLVQELGGLTRAETEVFLEASQLRRTEALVDLIHGRTQGHLLLLDLLVSQIVSFGLDDAEIADALPDLSWDLDQYLLTHVFSALSELELEVIRYLAISFVPLTTSDLAALLQAHSREALIGATRSLERRRLAHRVKLAYAVEPVVRDYTCRHATEVALTHVRLAELLSTRAARSGRVVQEVAYHFTMAGDHERADAQVLEHFEDLWNDGNRGWTLAAVEAAGARAHAASDLRRELSATLLEARLDADSARYLEAIDHYDTALRIADSMGDRLAFQQVSVNRAEITGRRGDFAQASDAYHTAALELEALGRPHDADVARHDLAALLTRYGRGDEAQSLLASLSRPPDARRAAERQSLLGLIATERADYGAAANACSNDERESRTLDDENGLARIANNRGVLALLAGDLRDAAYLFEQSRAFNHDQQDGHGEAQARGNLGVVAQVRGDIDLAIEHYAAALETFAPAGDLVSCVEIYANAIALPADARIALGFRDPPEMLPDRFSPSVAPRFLWNVSYGYLP
jgi:tetratricopeptide (TPR) repeat protein